MIAFVSKRSVSYILSLVLSVLSVIAYFTLPLHLGIDMTGGTVADYAYSGTLSDEQILAIKTAVAKIAEETSLSGAKAVNDTLVYRVSGSDQIVIEAGFNDLPDASEVQNEELRQVFNEKVKTLLSSLSSVQFTQTRFQNVGASFGSYIKNTAYLTLAIVIIAISLYIAYAFRGSIAGITSFPFAFVTAVSLAHDVLIAFGAYLLASAFFPEFKVDTFFITAMLTILGYSINDTIVVMDRIRTDLKLSKAKLADLASTINTAINETLARSMYTSLTIVIVLIAMFFFGPDAIRGFVLALIFGTIVGTYSSVCIAAPMLYDITKKR